MEPPPRFRADARHQDYDIVYFDAEDLSEAAEKAVEAQVTDLLAGNGTAVDVTNEARVHLWYEQRFHRPLAPYRSVEHAIATWPTTASSVGVRGDGDGFVVCAPFGLADLFAMVVRANTTLVGEATYRAKAERWCRTWPQLTVLPWPSGMSVGTDWHAWHEPYGDATSSLSRRLRLVQRHIACWLDERHGEALTVVSACAGHGHDVIGTLARRADADRVRATLLEYDERNVAAAQAAIDDAALRNVTVVRADAGDRAAYAGAVPADLVVMAGVFGNISDVEVRGTIAALAELCATGCHRDLDPDTTRPDLTPAVRRWLEAAGFVEQDFHAPADALFSVGVHHFAGRPRPLAPRGRLFRFRA